MGFNIARNGTEAVLGLVSGYASVSLKPIVISAPQSGASGTTYNLQAGSAVAIGGLAVGVLLQVASPMSAPNIADGLVDGGITLVSEHLGGFIANSMATPAPTSLSFARFGGVQRGALRGVSSNYPGPTRQNFGLPTRRVG